jgi:transforming growth factor-beta-induced protein
MNSRVARLLAALLALSLIAAACGDDDSAEPASSNDAIDQPAEAAEGAEEPAEEPAEMPGTIVEVASDNGSFTTLVAAVEAADLVDTLNGDGPFTVLAPTDEAFAAALADLGLSAEELLADTDLLTAVLTYHVIPGEVPSSQVVTLDGQSVATVNEALVTITVDGETVKINDATVTAVDVEASNGVIHVLDSVLLPPS